MAVGNFLIMNLLRIITPEEVGEIATKHNGGKFLSLTDLVNERIERAIYRDFSDVNSMEEIYEEHSNYNQAKILPFKKDNVLQASEQANEENSKIKSNLDSNESIIASNEVIPKSVKHEENENMSSFILIEKERLKRSQRILKQKEIFELYQKNSDVAVEEVKSSNRDSSKSNKAGILINKKHY
jgi:hypothetical protein